MKSKNSPEKLLIGLLSLEPVEFIGICKIIGVEIYKEVKAEETEETEESGKTQMVPREFYEIWCDVCDIINEMNRTRRRNLGKLIYAATKKDKEK